MSTELPSPINQPPSTNDQNIITAAKGGGINFIGQIISYVSSFIFSLILARWLGAEKLGLYTSALTVVVIVVSISFAGFNGGMDRYIPIRRKQNDIVGLWGVIQIGVGIPTIISVILTILLLIFSQPLAIAMDKPDILPILRIALIAIPATTLITSLISIPNSFKLLQYQVYTEAIVFNILKIVLSVMMLALGLDLVGITLAFVIATLVNLVLTFYYANKVFSFKRPLREARYDFREILTFSIPLYFSRLLNQFSGQFETLVLTFLSISANVGVYTTILRLSTIGNLFYSSLRKISTPMIAELYSQGEHDALKNLYQTTTKWTLMFNIPIFLIFLIFGEPVLSIFGQDFTVGSTGLIILAGSALFNAGTGMCGIVINMTGYSKLSFVNSIVYLASTIILDFLLIPRWPLLGAALAGGLTIVINNTIRLIEVYWLMDGLLPVNRSFWKLGVAIVGTGILTYPLTQFVLVGWPLAQLIILAPIMCLIYVTIIIGLKLSDEDRLILGKLRKRLPF